LAMEEYCGKKAERRVGGGGGRIKDCA